MDELQRRLREEMRGEHAPADGHDRLRARIRRRERARRLTAGGLGLALTALLAVAGYATLNEQRTQERPPASRPASSPALTGDPSPSDRPEPTSDTSPTPSTGPTIVVRPGSPPPVTLRFLDRSVQLAPYSYCYKSLCVDGGPSEPLQEVGSPDQVVVEFPLAGWGFTAYFSPAGDDCGRVQAAPLTPTGEGTFVLEPVGVADTYDVGLFGEGDGSLGVSFRWTTPTDGPLPTPEARLAVLANDDPVTSYGVELHVSNLASTPSSERAIITVRAANGREITFEATPTDRDCMPEGTVYWDGPDADGLAAAQLGDPPFTYEVELILDDVRYLATATWPDGEIVGEEPSVSLDFFPALPSLSADSQAPQAPEDLSGRTFASETVTHGSSDLGEDGNPRGVATGRLEFEFDERGATGSVRWWTGCNTFGSSFEVVGDRILVGEEIVGSAQGCPGTVDDPEWLRTFFRSDPTWQLTGERLTLTSDTTVIELDEVPANEG